ncbi:MAG: HAD family hydrolase [Erysipelotrichaceae bacterium]|nr:HAD family hydrolase [Erysipelotrichaceae bacterium]
MIKALLLDIDGTLLPRGVEKIDEMTVRAIWQAHEKGIRIIIATGRGYNIMALDVKQSLPVDYFITVNGGCINQKDGTVVFSYPMDPEDVERLIEVGLKYDAPFAFKFSDRMLAYNRYEDFTRLYCYGPIRKEWIGDETENRRYHLEHEMPIGCFFFPNGFDVLALQQEFPTLKFVPAGVGNGAGECYSIRINKGRTIKRLMDSIGIKLEECAAIGDSPNDEEMLQMCGIGIAMGNAHESTKRVADYVTADVYHQGIPKALKDLNII